MEKSLSNKYLPYLIELRKRLIFFLLSLVLIFLVLMPFDNALFHLLAKPLLQKLPSANHLIAIDITAPFFTPLKLAFFLALYLSMPILFYQVWQFLSPALYKREKNLIWPLLFFSSLLFYLGALFAYFVVFPLMFKFFINITPASVSLLPDISAYLSFCLKLFFAFGVAFEVPMIILILLHSGLIQIEKLIHARPYVIVMSFVIGMLLTPPDVISQILLALPIWFLYEITIIFAKRSYLKTVINQ